MRVKTTLLTLVVLAALGASAPSWASDAYHFALSKSAPEADAVVASPDEVRLWFTQAPQDNSVAIRVIDAAGDALETGEPIRDADDARVMSASIPNALDAGTYTVAWRGIGDDGHPVTGDFSFSVTAR